MPTTTLIASESRFFTAAVYKENHIYPLFFDRSQIYSSRVSYNQEARLTYINRYQIEEEYDTLFAYGEDYELLFTYNGTSGEFLRIDTQKLVKFRETDPLLGSFQMGISIDGGPYLLLDHDYFYSKFSPSYKPPPYIPSDTDVMTYEPVEMESTEDVEIPTTSTWTVSDVPFELENGSLISVKLFFSNVDDAYRVTILGGDGENSTLLINNSVYTDTAVPWFFDTYSESLLESTAPYTAHLGPMSNNFIPSSETFYNAEFFQNIDIEVNEVLSESEIFNLYIPISQNFVFTQFYVVYGISTDVDDALVDEGGDLISVANPDIGGSFDVGQIFEPTLLAGTVNVVTTPIASEEYFFSGARVEVPQDSPLVAVLPGEQGQVSRDRIAPSLRYYTLPTSGVLSGADLVQTTSNNLVPSYIRGENALFRDVIYSDFYIRNTSQSTDRTGINFWMNGGETLQLSTGTATVDRFYENSSILSSLAQQGIVVENEDYYLQNGQSSTSLFNQMNISAAVLPKNSPIRESEDNLLFNPAYQKIPLPDLKTGEYVGIRLRMEIEFDSELGLPIDYSFFHISYINGSLIETYPGQIYDYVSQAYFSQALPSVVIPFVTNYKKLLELIDRTTDELYDRYPPFFLDYRDI